MAVHCLVVRPGMENPGAFPVTGRTRKSAAERKNEIVNTAIRLAGEIGPDRVHLNTVTRPPAESFAEPVVERQEVYYRVVRPVDRPADTRTV